MKLREAIGSALRGMFDKAAFAPMDRGLINAIEKLDRVSNAILQEDIDARSRVTDDVASNR